MTSETYNLSTEIRDSRLEIVSCPISNLQSQISIPTMPNPATDKLLKILKYEVQTGHQDKAVTRGLQSFAGTWLADAARNNIDPDWAETVAQEMRDYSTNADETRRRATLDALMTRLRTPVVKGQRPASKCQEREELKTRSENPNSARSAETQVTSRSHLGT